LAVADRTWGVVRREEGWWVGEKGTERSKEFL